MSMLNPGIPFLSPVVAETLEMIFVEISNSAKKMQDPEISGAQSHKRNGHEYIPLTFSGTGGGGTSARDTKKKIADLTSCGTCFVAAQKCTSVGKAVPFVPRCFSLQPSGYCPDQQIDVYRPTRG
jgi:hypothetical protein